MQYDSVIAVRPKENSSAKSSTAKKRKRDILEGK